MPQDLRRTWQHFAKAAIQEQDPAKLTPLIEQLYRALEENPSEENAGEAQPEVPPRKRPKSENSASMRRSCLPEPKGIPRRKKRVST